MNSQKIKDQLRNLFSKEAKNQQEIGELNHWYESLQETLSKPTDLAQIKSNSWERIKSEIKIPQSKNAKRSKSFFGSWMWKAAIFLCICGAGYGLYSVLPEKADKVKIASGFYTNEVGKVSTFLLPDGSKVWLSTGSTVEFAEDFPRNRQVNLFGEAFFEVIPNPKSPFKITTGSITTEVLGTSFNLKSYDQTRVELSVYSGRVRFADHRSHIHSEDLLKGERISWTAEEGLSEIELFDLNQLPGWRQGKITFNNASIDVIKSTLKRWYKVDIEVEGNAENCHYSGEFTQASLDEILETISYTLNLTYKIDDADVTIHANSCE
ncbi:FecR domain-containing protein [uncultured Algoriphagus sp.]|uniref:FecR family protein n=1 Tax=uncultured Algoriphagus sp. TaxID=417365 RepID=UPI0030EBDBF0|tara:strand:- start:4953 stop:5921 length:969 start_codon:yes stop_codon:yes gene_type:complete